MKLQSYFATLDVKRGRVGMRNTLKKKQRVPVTIHGFIVSTWSDDDGMSQEFEVEVTKVETGE